MSTNPYQDPDFAKSYVLNEVNRSKNRYEFEVTHPATLQFLDNSVERVLDYGCGSGIFSAGITQVGRHNFNPSLETTGTDASSEMLQYAGMLDSQVEGLSFREWDATSEDSILQNRRFDRVFAKLVLNYVSAESLGSTVMPRLRECLNDSGLLVAVLPNPLREAEYRTATYQRMSELQINVGNFSIASSATSYHHTYEEMIQAADQAGFAYSRVLGLPDVRFEPYKQHLMKIAHPMPMILDTMNAAKRWVYVFGATEASAENFDSSIERFENWRSYNYPEIADRAHMLVDPTLQTDVDLPVDVPHEALYDYIGNNRVLTTQGEYVEHLTPKQKIKLAKTLAKNGMRHAMDISDFLTTV
jgi:SAM-dependent methyltransferase